MGRNYMDARGDKNPNYRSGLCVPGHEHKSIYNTWNNMRARCSRPTHPKYARYGGRGITVCQEWLSIDEFYKWSLANGWQKGYSIDRIDNDGNYEPSNCIWISHEANSRKKSTTKISIEQAAIIRNRIDAGEDEYELAKEYGVVHGTIWFIKRNFTHVADGECTKMIKGNKK